MIRYLYFGFGLQILSTLIFVLTSNSSIPHGKYEFPFWKKRYWWNGWKPIYKNTETLKWVIDLNHKCLIEGRMPPKHKMNWLAFLLFLEGILLQTLFVN